MNVCGLWAPPLGTAPGHRMHTILIQDQPMFKICGTRNDFFAGVLAAAGWGEVASLPDDGPDSTSLEIPLWHASYVCSVLDVLP